MKKSIITLAIAASLAAPAAAFAESKVYGNIHLTLQQVNAGPADGDFDLASNTSALGVKGSEDLGNGLKALYKVEFQIDAADDLGGGNGVTQRDTWVGLKGGFGKIAFGMFSSNYKQMGGKVDALYRTPIEGRGKVIETQSNLHGGRALNRGRQTNTVQYTSPKFAGIKLVANTTFSNAGNADETTGFGLRWSNKSILVYVDTISFDTTGAGDSESATKLGAKYSAKSWFIGGQFEDAADVRSRNYMHVNGGFFINSNNLITLTVGSSSDESTAGGNDSSSVAAAYIHMLSKMTMVYVGYGQRDRDVDAGDVDAIAFGIRKKF